MKTDQIFYEGPGEATRKDLLVYVGSGSEYGRGLVNRVKTAVEPSAWITDDLTALAAKLRQPKFHTLVVVLVASSDQDLAALLALRDLLEEAKVVLVLPAESWGWIDQAHKLRPRFVGYTDEDQGPLIQVLDKILSAEYP